MKKYIFLLFVLIFPYVPILLMIGRTSFNTVILFTSIVFVFCIDVIIAIGLYILIRKKQKVPSMPSWDKIVDMMYDKYLDAFEIEVVRTIYSKDKTMRYVILKDEKGYYTYCLEAIYQYDEDEWKYIYSDNESLPALWEPYGNIGNSLFETEENCINQLKNDGVYKYHFI